MPGFNFEFHPIGYLNSPFNDISDMPIQPSGAPGVRGKIILKNEFIEGLSDLAEFSHIYVIYVFHKIEGYQLTVTPFLDSKPHGVFSTRAPKRPNPIGLSVVRLLSIDNEVLMIENVDILDGTPVLDIKPYVPAFDQQNDVRIGWLNGSSDSVNRKRSDERFK